MTSQNALQMGVRIIDTPQEQLKTLKRVNGLSWRQIAKIDTYQGIPPGSLSTFAKTGWLAKKYRAQLGLPPIATVTVMIEGDIPDGAQVLTATRCACGRWYVSNHPARKSCFVCKPYGGRKCIQ